MGALNVFQKICELDSDALILRRAISWLSQTPAALSTSKIKDVLMNSRVNDVILQQGHSVMNFSDFCTLACESYVNRFAIDTTCLAFLGEEKQSDVAYLPCYGQSWAKQGALFFSQKVSGHFIHCSADAASIILTPIHIPAMLHGDFDAVSRNVNFDHGFKIAPPKITLIVIKNMLNGFSDLSSGSRFNLEQWNCPKLCLPLPYINMPQQTTTGAGAGSCGMEVILSVRDIIRSGRCLPSFQWEFP